MKKSFCFLLFTVAFGLGLVFHFVKFHNAYQSLCNSVSDRIYLPHVELKDWMAKCLSRSSLVNAFTDRQLIVNDFKKWMTLDGVSHFELQEPDEANSFWTGQTLDHGFQWEYLEQYILITEVAPLSSAALAGLKRGDLIESFDGKEIHSSYLRKNGQFSLLRKGQRWTIDLISRPYQKYYSPQFYNYGKFQIISITHFFNPELLNSVDSVLAQLPPNASLVIDLRENAGGDFAIALSFLNRFLCANNFIGEIRRPKFSQWPGIEFNSAWSQEDQLKNLSMASSLWLRTHAKNRLQSRCYEGSLKVLIGHATASTGELVAQALKNHRQAKVIGERSAGSLLVGVARSIESLGPGYLLYVPEAIYLDDKGQAIEKKGVLPDIERSYRLKDILLGQDSFLEGLP